MSEVVVFLIDKELGEEEI